MFPLKSGAIYARFLTNFSCPNFVDFEKYIKASFFFEKKNIFSVYFLLIFGCPDSLRVKYREQHFFVFWRWFLYLDDRGTEVSGLATNILFE